MKINKLLLAGFMCATLTFSANAAKKWSLSGFGSTAIIGVVGNQNISEQYDVQTANDNDEENEDTGLLAMAMDKLFYKDDPEVLTGQDRVDYCEDYLRYALETIASIKVAPQEDVLESESYNSIVKNPLIAMDYEISATGYIKNARGVTNKKARTLMNEVGVKSLVRATFKFDKVFNRESKWKCDVMPRVKMTIFVYNEKGTQVLMKDYISPNFGTLPVRKFKYDQNALIEMYPQLIESVINQFVMEYLE
ncbi:MAG: hypothetical protein II921_08720 [Treponema sp.]|nr:hypothetical protein [Treponema sp.]